MVLLGLLWPFEILQLPPLEPPNFLYWIAGGNKEVGIQLHCCPAGISSYLLSFIVLVQ